VPAQVLPNRIRVRRDPAIEALLTSLGAKLTVVEAPFEPEGGAYASAHGRDHGHAHDHHQGHAHGHHHDH
jgi:urease accessory protein